MNGSTQQPQPFRSSPLTQLILVRIREFYREPEAVFWVYGFPLIMIFALGIAFRSQPVERLHVDICDGPQAAEVQQHLQTSDRFELQVNSTAACFRRLRIGKTDLIVVPESSSTAAYEYHFDPSKPGSLVARDAVDEVLQVAAGRTDAAATTSVPHSEPGGRYIDFLVPGLLGMGLMGGGLWGVGFVIVDLRIRQLLKRFLATPMKKKHFLTAIMVSRMVFMIPEVILLLIFSRLVFGVVVHGNWWVVLLLIVFGAVMFSGLGLLVACRARTLEAVSGLMNLVMLPMWIMSGIFFSADRFPDAVQPFIKLLPLTPVIDALRAVMLEGAPLAALTVELSIIGFWTVISFAVALKWFRWT